MLLPRGPAGPGRLADLAHGAPRPDTDPGRRQTRARTGSGRTAGTAPGRCGGGRGRRLLGVIAARADTGQTGAVWQRATLAAAERHHNRERALAIMLDRYLQCAQTGLPVHTWPVIS